MPNVIVEYAGLTQEAATLIEGFRTSPGESKSDILVRVLRPGSDGSKSPPVGGIDLGQGVVLPVGEKLYLYLSEDAKRSRKANAVAEVMADGFYLSGKKIEPSHGSVLQPAMKQIQEKIGHRNERGEIISLSAWRQWHVLRDGNLVPVFELKAPNLARKRGRVWSNRTDKSLKELGL